MKKLLKSRFCFFDQAKWKIISLNWSSRKPEVCTGENMANAPVNDNTMQSYSFHWYANIRIIICIP